jgi:hypothetical protein
VLWPGAVADWSVALEVVVLLVLEGLALVWSIELEGVVPVAVAPVAELDDPAEA